MDKNYYWTVLKYIKLLQFRTILALKDGDRNIVVFIKAKEAFIKKSAFSKLMPNSVKPLITPYKITHTKITKETVAQILVIQVATKALGLDKINF